MFWATVKMLLTTYESTCSFANKKCVILADPSKCYTLDLLKAQKKTTGPSAAKGICMEASGVAILIKLDGIFIITTLKVFLSGTLTRVLLNTAALCSSYIHRCSGVGMSCKQQAIKEQEWLNNLEPYAAGLQLNSGLQRKNKLKCIYLFSLLLFRHIFSAILNQYKGLTDIKDNFWMKRISTLMLINMSFRKGTEVLCEVSYDQGHHNWQLNSMDSLVLCFVLCYFWVVEENSSLSGNCCFENVQSKNPD